MTKSVFKVCKCSQCNYGSAKEQKKREFRLYRRKYKQMIKAGNYNQLIMSCDYRD